MMPALELRNVECGSWHRPVSLQVKPGEVVVLLGRNGAGKTTLLNTIAGLLPIVAGDILVEGLNVNKMDGVNRSRSGIHIALEGRQLFGRLSVKRNLALGMYKCDMIEKLEENVEEILSAFPDLREKLEEPAASLSGGQQTMVSLGRALMNSPAILLLDEPTMGLDPQNSQRVIDVLRSVCNHRNTSVVVAEQNGVVARAFPEHLVLLVGGEVTFEGSLAEARNGERLREVFP